jgi:ankyrin repeat protein
VKATDNREMTALHLVSYYQNHLEVLTRSLRINVDIENRDRDKLIAFQIESSKAHFEIVKTLIEFGGNVNAKNEDGFTPLFLASSHENMATIQYFIEHGANADVSNNSGATALHFAVAFGRSNLVKFLLKHNADDNIRSTDACSGTSLPARPKTHSGVLEDDIPDVLTNNIDVMTALELVIEFGRFDIVRDLIAKCHNLSFRTGMK